MKLILLVAALTQSVSAFGLNRAEINEAIEQGRAGRTLEKKCRANGENGFDIIVEGPAGRVMRAAAEARRLGNPFTADDVTSAMSGPAITVRAIRDPQLTSANLARERTGTAGAYAMPADSALRYDPNFFTAEFTIRSKSGEPQVNLAPTGRIAFLRAIGPNYQTNLPQGAALLTPIPGADMSASFSLEAFYGLPAGNVEVVVFVTDAGERKCNLSEKDRKALR